MRVRGLGDTLVLVWESYPGSFLEVALGAPPRTDLASQNPPRHPCLQSLPNPPPPQHTSLQGRVECVIKSSTETKEQIAALTARCCQYGGAAEIRGVSELWPAILITTRTLSNKFFHGMMRAEGAGNTWQAVVSSGVICKVSVSFPVVPEKNTWPVILTHADATSQHNLSTILPPEAGHPKYLATPTWGLS